MHALLLALACALALAPAPAAAFRGTRPLLVFARAGDGADGASAVLTAPAPAAGYAAALAPLGCARLPVVVDAQGLHYDHVDTNAPGALFAKLGITPAAPRATVKYLAAEDPVADTLAHYAGACGIRSVVTIAEGDDTPTIDYPSDARAVIVVSLKPATAASSPSIAENAFLARTIKAIKAAVPADTEFAVILTSSIAHSVLLEKRQVINSPLPNPVLPSRETIFGTYLFLTPGVLMGIISTLVVIAILLFGLSFLSAVQTPIRFDDPKKAQ